MVLKSGSQGLHSVTIIGPSTKNGNKMVKYFWVNRRFLLCISAGRHN